MREKQKKKRKTRTKDEKKDDRSNKQKRGKKNPQNKENEPTIWQFWLGFEEKLRPQGSGMARGISGCGVQDNPQTPSRTPGYTFKHNCAP
jgi:hypothetical protein